MNKLLFNNVFLKETLMLYMWIINNSIVIKVIVYLHLDALLYFSQ